jgi:hypothetical protein
MFPSKKALEKEDFESLTEAAYLMILALRILVHENDKYSIAFVQKTARSTSFRLWRADGNDLYMVLHALTTGMYALGGNEPETVNCLPIMRWLREIKITDAHDKTETSRLFVRMDRLLGIREASLRAVRRLIQDWPELSDYEKRLATTRLLQMIRTRLPKSELLPRLQVIARNRDWEIEDVCDQETGDNCEADAPKRGYVHPTSRAKPENKNGGLLASLAGAAAGFAGGYALTRRKVKETASAGATGAASIASVAAPLGAEALGPGFAGKNGHKGIYQPMVIRRNPK